jgi:Lon-like protease
VRAIPLWVKLLGGICVLAGIVVALAFVPTGDVAYVPTAPIDLDGSIEVDGRPVPKPQGSMHLVGVTEKQVKLLERILLDVSDPSIDFGPAPAGRTADAPSPSDVRAMDSAKQVAAGIAFDQVGERVDWRGTGATVVAVAPNGPARSVLRRGDIITRVNSTVVDTSVEAGAIIHALRPGSRVRLGVQRAGSPVRVTLSTVAPRTPQVGRRSEIGVELATIGLRVGLPRTVRIDPGNVVGPSAGLAFALYLIEGLSEEDLLQGRHVVVTGSLAPDGTVLPVGRIRQKALATQQARNDIMLVPELNAQDARRAIEGSCPDGGCVLVVPVRSVSEAVGLLRLPDAQLRERFAAAAGD